MRTDIFCNKTSDLQCCGGKGGKLQTYPCEINNYIKILKGTNVMCIYKYLVFLCFQALAVNQGIVVPVHEAALLNTWQCFHMELKLCHSTLFTQWKINPGPIFIRSQLCPKWHSKAALFHKI